MAAAAIARLSLGCEDKGYPLSVCHKLLQEDIIIKELLLKETTVDVDQ